MGVKLMDDDLNLIQKIIKLTNFNSYFTDIRCYDLR